MFRTAIASIEISSPRGRLTLAGADLAGAGSGMCRAETLLAVEPIVGEVDQPVGAVIDVQQDSIEALRGFDDDVVHVANVDRQARIGERTAEDVRQRPSGPGGS